MKKTLLILLCICGAVFAQLGVNLVQNPDFEELDDRGFPAKWNYIPETFKSATDNVFEGKRSVHYFNTVAGKYQFFSQDIPAKPGHTYEYTIYAKQVNRPEAKGAGRPPKANAFIEFWFKGNYLGGDYTPSILPLNTDWVKIVGQTTIPENATRVNFGFRATPDGTNLCDIWFDKCSVVEIEGEYINNFATTNKYRDMSDGGMVTIFQGLGSAFKRLPENAASTIRMEILDSTGKAVMTLSPDSIQKEFVTFTFDSSKLPAGKYALQGSCTSPLNHKEYKSNSAFTKVDKLPEFKAYIDDHRRMIVDGKPFFPLGMYFGPVTKENLQPYIDTKFNCLMPYNPPTDPAMYDYMHENNLKVFYAIKDAVSSRTHDAKATETKQASGIARLEKWKHHPAIIAWYINDELSREFVNDAITYRRKCEEHDPSRPTWTVLCTPQDFRTYVPASDIHGCDPYPIPDYIPLRAFNWTKTMNDAVMGSKMIIQVPQAFCWGRYWVKYGFTKERCANCRRPSFLEMDAMSWMCIAGGANGLIYYSYFDLMARDKATDILPRIPFDEHFGECKQIAERIMAHEKVLLSIEKPLDFTVKENAGGEVAFRPYALDGITWLLVVNTSEKAARTIRLE
ncbi:MAG: carbohydrate binding domain-containing protein, partial [Victivallales bacterium]|nr:carbohydrate binding domain-containing protein [Victivallales bacterium]